MWLVGILGAIVALAGVEFYAIHKYGRVGAPACGHGSRAVAGGSQRLAPIASSDAIEAPVPEGWLDEPVSESVVGTKLALHGWALAKDGIARVEVRVDDRIYQAQLRHRARGRREGEARLSGQSEERLRRSRATSRTCSPMRTTSRSSRSRRTGANRCSRAEPDPAGRDDGSGRRCSTSVPSSRRQPFYFLMMTSGVGIGGADEIESQYADYRSRTQKHRHLGPDPLHAHDQGARAGLGVRSGLRHRGSEVRRPRGSPRTR